MKLIATGFAPGQTYQAAILDDTRRPVDAGAFVGTGEAEQASGFVITDAAGTPVLISQFA